MLYCFIYCGDELGLEPLSTGIDNLELVVGFGLNNCSTKSVGEGSSVSLKGVTCRQYWGWIKYSYYLYS